VVSTIMYLVFLAFLIGLASSSPALGSRQCSWGPKYWCANIPQASECGAVKHCIKAVWTKQNVPVDEDEVKMNKIFLTHFFQKHVAFRVVFYVHDPCFSQKF